RLRKGFVHVRSAAVPPRTVPVGGRLPGLRMTEPYPHQILRSRVIAFPLPPQQRPQLVSEPAVEFFQYALHFGELEVRDPSPQQRVPILDHPVQISSTTCSQRFAHFLRKPLATWFRHSQLRFPVPRHRVAQKLPLPRSRHRALLDV